MADAISMSTESVVAAQVTVELTIAEPVQPGRPVLLHYRLSDEVTGQPLTDVTISHEKLMHLIVVDSEFEHFQHLHPWPTDNAAEFQAEVSFPAEKAYLLFAEFARSSGRSFYSRDVLKVGQGQEGEARLLADSGPRTTAGHTVSLEAPANIHSGRPTHMRLLVSRSDTGEGVTNLRPYLGAAAHIVFVHQNTEMFGHTHGEIPGGSEHGGHHVSRGSDTRLGPVI